MRAFLAVSVDPGTTLAPAPRALSYLDGTGGVVTHEAADGWLAWTGPEQDDDIGDPAHGFTVRLTRSVRTRAGDVPAKALAAMLGDGSTIDGAGLAAILPPFAAAHRAGPGRPIVVCGDWVGMRQLFRWQGAGVAAVSTSALALAALSGAQLDPATVGMQSLLGHQVGTNTLFSGVSKLAHGSLAVLHNGMVEQHRYLDRDDGAGRAGRSTVQCGR